MRVAVVGHVEWVTFARVEQMPGPGEIVHASGVFDVPAGGGPVAAVQLAKLNGSCALFTALGDDAYGHRAYTELEALGLEIHACFRDEPQRRAFTHVVETGERTITVLGERLDPRADDPLPWDELASCDAVYFCAGDVGALRATREARVLVATSRELPRLREAGVALDAAVGSASDPHERYKPGDLDPAPRLGVWTEGASGGRYLASETTGRYAATPPPGLVVDTYGAGDSFVAGLTYALASGADIEGALAFAARCGASCVTGRGPYEGQLQRGP